MKKLICITLINLLCLSVISCTDTPIATPNEVEMTEKAEALIATPASDFEYEVIKEENRVAITKYIGTSKNVVVPSEIEGLPVTSFKNTYTADNTSKEGAFEGSDIETVVLGENIRTVGVQTFKDCNELKSVIFKENTKTVGYKAFENCTQLEIVDLSDTQLFRIDYYAFRGCTALREVKLPNCIEEICKEAFYNCTALEKIPFPESLRLIEDGAFFNCVSLKSINIPTQLELYAGMQTVFCHNYALETITFDEGRESIEGYAFFSLNRIHVNKNLKIIIPKSVKKLSFYTFFVYGPTKLVFLGDCPEVFDETDKCSYFTISYNPNMEGWEDCMWKDKYTLIPLE